jgi:hypothetical protein
MNRSDEPKNRHQIKTINKHYTMKPFSNKHRRVGIFKLIPIKIIQNYSNLVVSDY